MPSQLAIVITASALTGAAQAAIKGLGGSMMQMGRTGSLATNKLTSEYSALTQRVGMLNSKLANVGTFATAKRNNQDLAQSYAQAKDKANALYQSLAQAKQFAAQSQSALTAYRKELDGQTGKATDAQRLKLKLLGDQARGAQTDIGRLTTEFKLAGAQVKKLDRQLNESRLSLQTQRGELLKNGVATSQLATHKSALIRQLAQEQSRIDALGKSYDAYTRKQRQIGKASIQQTELRNQGASMHGEAIGALGTAWAVVNPLRAAINASSEYRVELTRIGNTSEMTREQSLSMGNELLEQSVKFGVAADKLKGGLGEMVAGGIDPTIAMNSIGSMASVIKAYNADATEVGATNNALITNMGYTAQGLKRPWDILATSAAQGNFELKDMAKWLPTLGASVKALGSVGDEGTAVSGAFLQIAKRGAGSADEAANNYQNFLQKLSQGGTEKNAKDMGFSIRDTMLKAKKEGLDPVEAAVLKIKDITGGDQFKIAELFPDMQAQNFLRPAIQNWADYKKIKDDSLKGDGKVDKDAQKIAEESAAISEKAGAAWTRFKVTIGDALAPVWNKVVSGFTLVITAITNGVTQFPRLTAGVFTLIAAFTAFRVASFATRAAMLIWKLVVVGSRLKVLSLMSALYQGKGAFTAMQLGLSASSRALIRQQGMFGSIARGFAHATRWARTFGASMRLLIGFNPLGLIVAGIVVGAVLIYKYWKPIKAFFGGVWDGIKAGMAPVMPLFDRLSSIMSRVWTKVAPFVRPIITWFKEFFTVTQVGEGGARSFGQAVGQFIGGAIGAVATFVSNRITQMKTAFQGGLMGIIGLIINWSPLGAFYSAFAGVMSWFGVTLPSTFTGFGSMIMQGLLNGISSMFDTVVGKIRSLGTAISNAFTSNPKIEVRSPSRAFKRYGGFITEGLGIGINKGAVRPLKAIGAFASNLQQRFKNRAGELRSNLSARMQANSAELAAARAQQQSAQAAQYGGHTIHYSPQIYAPGGDPNVINGLLKLSKREFEAMLERYFADKARRAY